MHSQLSLLQSSFEKMVEDNEKERNNRLKVEQMRINKQKMKKIV